MDERLEDFGHDVASWAAASCWVPRAAGFHFAERAAPARLGGLVVATWQSRVGGADDVVLRVAADACVELTRSSDGVVRVFGPSASWSSVRLERGQTFSGVRLAPGAAGAVLRVNVATLRDRVVEAGEIPALRGLAALHDRWRDHVLARAAAARASVEADASVRRALRLLAQTPLDIPAIAAACGLSERHFRRVFEQHVGLPPHAYRRVARLRRALTSPQAHGSLAALAADHGFADQAHLTRESNALAGRSPRQLRGDVAPR